DRAAGVAEFRRLTDAGQKQAIAREFMQNIAALHAMDAGHVRLDGGAQSRRIADHVRAELAIWRAMADEVGRPDPLIDFAFAWLQANLPDPDERVVLAHGDAGPGNFMFDRGRLTALIDWELAHLGDPMEDLAWFSMRCVMEPVPDFAASLRDYETFAGRPIDRARVLYHRVFVSARVVVIRHRNVTGEPGHAIVSRGLNRRLLVEALAAASGTALPPSPPVEAADTAQAALYDRVLNDLRDVVVARSTDRQVTAAAKNAAKVVKYLREIDRLGRAADNAELAALAALLGRASASVETGHAALSAALRAGTVPFERALEYFAGHAAREAQLAAAASGGIAHRHYPKLP
ncbi:MAG TPA: phosphotransferase family protein, partial [Vineibacter sp.]|nr:phosphotransferase family protein [Vineibacter sp.]